MVTLSQNTFQVARWRDDFVKAMQDFQDDSPPKSWSDVFVPESHYKALLPQTMLVEGMRGAGKSFWTRVLYDKELRAALAQTETDGRLSEELGQITDCKGVFWDQARAQDLPSKVSVKRWLATTNFEPSLFWAVVVLAQFDIDTAWGMPPTDDLDPWSARVEWAQQNPERVTRALNSLDAKFAATGQSVLIVIDGLDVVSSRFADTQKLMRGLFELLLNFRYAKGLRFKVFVREDILTSAAATVSDASKLINEKVTLNWTQQDLFGLAFHYLGQRSAIFRRRFKDVSQISWRETGPRYAHPELFNASAQEKLWVALAGPYMGSAATKGHSYSWIFNHLADGKRRVSPRTFLKAIKRSLEATVSRFPEYETVLHHEAIRDGVRLASTDRVNELDNEYRWVREAVRAIGLKRKTVPLDWDELVLLWQEGKSTNKDTLSKIENQSEDIPIPWDSSDSLDLKTHNLRDAMVDIGVFQLRERKGVLRVDLPDIYRLGYGVGRYGGMAVSR